MAAAMGSMLTAESSPESPRMSCRYCRTMKMNPKRRRTATKIDRLPAARPGVGEHPGVEHRGAAVQLPGDEAGQDRAGRGQAGQRAGGRPSGGGGLDDRVHQRDQAAHGQDGAAAVEAGGVGVGRLGHEPHGADDGGGGQDDVQPEHRRPRPQFQQQPGASRPKTAAPPATAAQTLTARVRCSSGKVPVMVDRVAGMTSAAPRPMTARRPISSLARSGGHGHRRPGAEDRPGRRSAPAAAAVAVAEGPGGQQQRGEHQGISVDDPGQLGLGWRGWPGRWRAARRSATTSRPPPRPAPGTPRRSPRRGGRSAPVRKTGYSSGSPRSSSRSVR